MIHVRRLHRSLVRRHLFTRQRFPAFSTCVLFRSWECAACTFTNQSNMNACKRCEVERDESAEAHVTPKNLLQWKCACGALNGLLCCTCRQCGKEPEIQDEIAEQPEEKVSDSETQWVCFCGAKNPLTRKECVECAQSTAKMAESSRETVPVEEKSHTPATERQNDFWTCSCGASNRAYRSECAVCGENIEPEVQRNLLAACIQKEKDTQIEPKPREFNQTPDWTCPSCAYVNYGSRLDCRQCGRSKVGQNLSQQEIPLDWICVACSFSNFATRFECYRCHRPKATKGADPEKATIANVTFKKDFPLNRDPTKFVLSDWTCTSCSYMNFRARVECRRCGDKKAAVQQQSQDRGSQGPSDAPQASSPNVEKWPCICGELNFIGTIRCLACLTKRPQVQGMPGDWVCFCGYLNYKYRQDCLRCLQPKKAILFELEEGLNCHSWKCHGCKSSSVQKPGIFRCNDCSAERQITSHMRNWVCANCQKSNNVGRIACRVCGSKKASHGAATPAKREVWRCEGCGNVNQHSHVACLNCSKQRSELPATGKVVPSAHPNENMPIKEFLRAPVAATSNPRLEEFITTEDQRKPIDAAAVTEWVCTCGKLNDLALKKCGKCEKTRFRVSVWYCVSCRTFNSCDTVNCGRCGESREDSKTKQAKLSCWECRCGEKNEGSDVACSKCGLIRNCPYGQQLAIRPGDWRCECDMVNKRPKRFCSHCRVPRRLLEWTCHCGTKNSTSRVICAKCQSLPENGRWICSCGYSNFAGRMLCHQCTKMRPTEDGLTKMLSPDDAFFNAQSKKKMQQVKQTHWNSDKIIMPSQAVSESLTVQGEGLPEAVHTVVKAPPPKSSRKPKKLQKEQPLENSSKLTEEKIEKVKKPKNTSVKCEKTENPGRKKSTQKKKANVEN